MKSPLAILFLLCWLLSPVQGWAIDGESLSVNGALKSLNLYLEKLPPGSADGVVATGHARFDFSLQLAGQKGVDLAVNQRLLWTSRPSTVTLPDLQSNRFFDLEKTRRESERLSGQLEIDRLLVHGEAGRLSWAIGRQAIGFGRISLFSPLDVIAPFSPEALDTDVRPGVDALQLTRFAGLAGQLGGVMVAAEDSQYNSYLVTAGENLNAVDLLFLGGRLRGRSLLGFGLAGEIGKVGLKTEISWYRGRDVGRPDGDLQQRFSVAAVEGWYRFDNGVVLIGEYLYNGFGTHDPSEYPVVAASAPVREGLGFLLAKHYLMLAPSYQFHPLISFDGLLIYNLEDRSGLVRPRVVFSLADNLQLDLFWALTFGSKTGTDTLSGLSVVRSEFGSRGDSGGLFVRFYF